LWLLAAVAVVVTMLAAVEQVVYLLGLAWSSTHIRLILLL
jgi:hypothetical protein